MTGIPTGARGLAGALSSLVAADLDVADVLAHLVSDAADVLEAAAVALLTQDGTELALLAATSHRAVEIEMLQAQRLEGPCVDTIRTGRAVRSDSVDDMVARWGGVGAAVAAAGFDAVEAYPMRWMGEHVGGLNVFYTDGRPELGYDALKQAYADMATLVVAQSDWRSPVRVTEGLEAALKARELVEVAKGVIAERDGVSMEEAYQRLLDLADASTDRLTRVAAAVVESGRSAHRGSV